MSRYNLIKHAQATCGLIELKSRDGWADVLVAQDGKGRASGGGTVALVATGRPGMLVLRERLAHPPGRGPGDPIRARGDTP